MCKGLDVANSSCGAKPVLLRGWGSGTARVSGPRAAADGGYTRQASGGTNPGRPR